MSFQFTMKRWVVIILVSITATTLIIMTVPMSIYNYYTYTLPMKDPLIGYGGSDFHYPHIALNPGFLVMASTTLLEDGSINVEFRPDSRYIDYPGSNFAHFENIKVGQTFITSCRYPDNSNKTLRIYPSYEELRKANEESTIVVYDADEEYFKNNCNDGISDDVFSDETCKRLYSDFLRNITITISKRYGYTQPYLDKEFYDKPTVDILKYMGTGNFNGVPVYGFHHVYGYLRDNVPCDYPQVIEHSIDLVELDIPDWYICNYPELFRPTLVLDELRDSDMCAEYE